MRSFGIVLTLVLGSVALAENRPDLVLEKLVPLGRKLTIEFRNGGTAWSSTTFQIRAQVNAITKKTLNGIVPIPGAVSRVTVDLRSDLGILPGAQATVTVKLDATSRIIELSEANNERAEVIRNPLPNEPSLYAFIPSAYLIGATVILEGRNLSTATSVKVNGVAATFRRVGIGNLEFTVPAGASSGYVTVTTPVATATSPHPLTVILRPSISSFSPSEAAPGEEVAVNGDQLGQVTGVSFNGTAASFTVVSGQLIRAQVPAGATTGPIFVTTPAGGTESPALFRVSGPLAISGVSPRVGPTGTRVSVRGSNFTSVQQVTINGTPSPFTVVSPTKIELTVPVGSLGGNIQVTGPSGSVESAESFTVVESCPDVPLGESGHVAAGFPGRDTEVGLAVGIQPDGKMLLAGYSKESPTDFRPVIVRFDCHGSVDRTYAVDGRAVAPFGSTVPPSARLVMQADGKAVIAVSRTLGTSFAMLRFNTDGTLDGGWGQGGVRASAGGLTVLGSITVQADQKLLVTGSRALGGQVEHVLERYHSDGTIDTGFATGGKLVLTASSIVAVQSDGKILTVAATGNSALGTKYDFSLARWNADGTADTGFGAQGKVVTDFAGNNDVPSAVTVAEDGKITVAGTEWWTVAGAMRSRFALARYESSGALDVAFGSGGKVTSAVDTVSFIRSVHAIADGKVVVSGVASSLSPLPVGGLFDLVVARYGDDGQPDPSFAGTGFSRHGSANVRDFSAPSALQSDGSLVVGGTVLTQPADKDFALVRYRPDGRQDYKPLEAVGPVTPDGVVGPVGSSTGGGAVAPGAVAPGGQGDLGGVSPSISPSGD